MRAAAVLFTSLLSCTAASAFLAPRALPSAASRASSSSSLRMQIALDTDLAAGESAPLGYFDPLKLSVDKDRATIKKWREAELKHGRVAMLAALGMTVQEHWHPLFGLGDKEMGESLVHFQEVEAVAPGFLLGLVFFIGFVEGNSILNFWQPKEEVPFGDVANLKDEYLTGDWGLDPLGLTKDPEAFTTMRTKELNNGRLAMIACIGMWVEELLGRVTEIV